MPSTAKTVLVVDDDPAMRAMIADCLGDRGFRVVTAADGGEMARVLAEGTVHLILLDLKLPDEDGMNLIRCRTRTA